MYVINITFLELFRKLLILFFFFSFLFFFFFFLFLETGFICIALAVLELKF